MVAQSGLSYTMHLEVFLQAAIVRGILETSHDRLSSYLVVRQGDQAFSVRRATLEFADGKPIATATTEYLIYLQEVYLIADLSAEERAGRSEFNSLFVKKSRRKALLSVGAYLVQGDLHLPAGGGLNELLFEKSCFLPVTEAVLLDRPDISPRTYLVNRAKIGFVSAFGQEDAER